MKTKQKDPYYTSEKFADELMEYINFDAVNTVADICVGGGQLLNAALRKKNSLQCYGTDISEGTIKDLASYKPEWKLAICDVLDQESRRATFLAKQKFDLILLNLPFTCKGSVICPVSFRGEEYHVSTAMSFLIAALDLIADDGMLYAIMPIGTIYSHKDEKIWKEIFMSYKVTIHRESERVVFGDKEPNVVVLSVKAGETTTPFYVQPRINIPFDVKPVRGTKNMVYLSKHPGTVQLIHTTSLQKNAIISDYSTSLDALQQTGPGVLIPRVGLPKRDKICIMSSKTKAVISDCVILIQTTSAKQARALKKILLGDWERFSSLYKGTGAKYITMQKLSKYLTIDDNGKLPKTE